MITRQTNIFKAGTNQLYTDLMSCQATNCGGYKSETSTSITFTQDMIDNGSWELCLIAFNDSGPGNGYDPNNNLARVEVFNSSNTLIQIREFNSTTDFCQSGSFPYISIGPAIQAGQAYTFKVTSFNANATFRITAPGDGDNEIVGGLRIKQTKVHDRFDTANDIITNYSYLQDGSTNSSEKLFREPNYAYQLNAHTVLFTSYSEAPLTSFAGSHIGYARVVTSQAGNGRTEMAFETEDDQNNVHMQFPVPPAKYKAEAGVVNESNIEKEDGTVITTTTTTRYSGDNYEIIGSASGNGVMFSARNVMTYSGSGSSLDDEVAYTTYQLRTSIYRPNIVITTKDGVSISTDYDYHPNNLLADETVMTNSNGDSYKENITYVTDYVTTSIRNKFAARNIKYLPYRTYKYQNGSLLDGTRNYYRLFDQNGNNPTNANGPNRHPRLFIVQRYARTFNASGALQSGSYVEQMRFTDYSDDGLIASYEEPNWDPVTITYDGKLPTSKSFLGHTTQYVYETGGSKLKSVIAVDGTQTDYTYDDLMRLETVEDVCKDVTTIYSYTLNNGPGLNSVSVFTDYPTDPTGRSDVDDMEDISYKDGLGREIQTVAKELGPSSNEDIITSVDYDQYGRVVKMYEPQAIANNGGNYESINPSWNYSTTAYEASPLSRKLSSTPASWYATSYTYSANVSGDNVKINGGTSTYATGRLMKTTVTDPNGNKLITFTDKRGRKVLSRRTDATDQVSKRLDTYYVYDRKDRLIKVLPPGATTGHTGLIYTYLYDGEDRVLEKKIPGKDYIEYRCNNRDLLAAEQDGNLRADGKWFAYSYDAFGREKESGFYNSTPPGTITDLIPTEALTKTFYGILSYEKDKIKTVETKILNGGNDWLTTTKTYSTCGLLTSQTGNNHLNLTATETTVNAYDGADNLITSTYNHAGVSGTAPISSTHYYDFAGRNSSNTFQVGSGSNTVLNSFVYDEKGNVATKYQGGTGLSGTLAYLQKVDYSYLDNGMLQGINLDGLTGSEVALPANGSTALMPTPANPGTANADDKDLFYLNLYRNFKPYIIGSGTAPERYNGDISYLVSQVRGRRQMMFGVFYDEYDRMTDAKFYERNSAPLSNPIFSNAHRETVAYDDRGNITSLDRNGVEYNSGSNTYDHEIYDDMAYSYVGASTSSLTDDNNRISSIFDNSTSGLGYNGSVTAYQYDVNGNTTYDPSRGVTIDYNHLDLPTKISWLSSGQQRLEMTYDASGTLLKREKINPSGTTIETRDFIGGIEYVDNVLESISHQEGRVYFDNGTQRYDYALTDHLGNTRLIYSDLNGDGIPQVPSEIIQEEHYLPFGMKMVGPWMGAGAAEETKYGYNGIEHVDEFDLGVNMAFYRTLDPLTGRWWQVDPKAESFMGLSPYNSMGNSPMTFADPMGDEPITLAAILIGAAIGAGTHTASHLIQNNGTFQNWNWGAFAGSVVAGGVGAGVSGALANAGIGGFAGGFGTGAASGFAQSTVSGLINGNLDGGIIAQSTFMGGLIGGTISGIGAAIDGRNFGDGSELLETEVLASDQLIGDVEQNAKYNCGPACGESIDGTLTQDNIRDWFGGNPETTGIPDADLWQEFANRTGKRVIGTANLGDPATVASSMNSGAKIVSTLRNADINAAGHSVVLKSVTKKTFAKLNGRIVHRYSVGTMNPSVGRVTSRSWGSFSRANRFFIFR